MPYLFSKTDFVFDFFNQYHRKCKNVAVLAFVLNWAIGRYGNPCI